MSEIKPCPFCDSKATYNNPVDFWTVVCSQCKAQTALFNTATQALEAWNMRKSPRSSSQLPLTK